MAAQRKFPWLWRACHQCELCKNEGRCLFSWDKPVGRPKKDGPDLIANFNTSEGGLWARWCSQAGRRKLLDQLVLATSQCFSSHVVFHDPPPPLPLPPKTLAHQLSQFPHQWVFCVSISGPIYTKTTFFETDHFQKCFGKRNCFCMRTFKKNKKKHFHTKMLLLKTLQLLCHHEDGKDHTRQDGVHGRQSWTSALSYCTTQSLKAPWRGSRAS